MIRFHRVRWKNFLSTGNTFTEISMCDHHTTILLGDSGSGKSTFLDAITFALFNKPFRSINIPALVNSINEKNCLVEIEFSVSGKEYLIRRGLAPKIFEIWCDNVLVNQEANARDYQSDLEKKILKCNYKSFTQIVVLGAAGFIPFMQLKPSDRRTVIESLLDIVIFSIMNKILAKKCSLYKQDYTANEQMIFLTREKINLHQKYINEQLADKEKKIEDNQLILAENQLQMQQYVSKNNELNEQIADLKLQLNLKKDIEKRLDDLTRIYRNLNDSVKKIEKEIVFYTQNDDCPTCHQHIDEKFRELQKKDKSDKLVKINDGIKQAIDKISEQSDKMSAIKTIENKIDSLHNQISKNSNSIDAIQRYIQKVTEEIVILKTKTAIVDNSGEVEQLKTELVEYEAEKESLANQKIIQDMSINLLKDSGIKAKIIKQYLPLINKYTNTFLHKMNFFVTFNIDEEFNESIKSRGRDSFHYASFSEGEKQRIDLALLFTWRTIAKMKNSVNTNLLIMDEVLDSYLDTSATENVLQLLSSDLFKDTNIFVISHKETITDKFQASLRFNKKKNFSFIE